METILDYVMTIDNPVHREKMESIFSWIQQEFPMLESRIAWNAPNFTYNGTFIMGFSVAKKHFSVNPEPQVIQLFSEKIDLAGYTRLKALFQIKWEQEINFDLLKELIEFNIKDKAECTTYFRK